MQPTPRVEPRHHRGHGFTSYGRRNPWLQSMQPAPRVSRPNNLYLNQPIICLSTNSVCLNQPNNVHLRSVIVMRSIPPSVATNQHWSRIDLRASVNLCERPLPMIQVFSKNPAPICGDRQVSICHYTRLTLKDPRPICSNPA